MAEEKKIKKDKKYKATDPSRFKDSHTKIVPKYAGLSKGESVALDTNNKHVQGWLRNKIIEEV
jgi:hypothetical protein